MKRVAVLSLGFLISCHLVAGLDEIDNNYEHADGGGGATSESEASVTSGHGAQVSTGNNGVGGYGGTSEFGGSAGTAGFGGDDGCIVPLTDCQGECVDTQTNQAHCGQCSTMCLGDLICQMGSCSCAGSLSACDNTCVDLDSSGDNCGNCGLSCFGGNCSSGDCQQFLVHNANPQSVFDVAVPPGTNDAFFTLSGSGTQLWRVPFGGTPALFATVSSLNPGRMTFDGADVFWNGGGSTSYDLWRIPLAGGNPVNVCSISTSMGIPTIVGNHVVFATQYGVYSCPKGSSGSSPVERHNTSPNAVFYLASDGNVIFYQNGGAGIYKLDPVNWSPALFDSTVGQSLVASAGFVYFSTGSSGEIYRKPVGGGAKQLLASGLPHPQHLEVDATHLYFYTDPGAIRRVPVAGGAVETIATGYTQAIGVGANMVFWGPTKSLWAVAK